LSRVIKTCKLTDDDNQQFELSRIPDLFNTSKWRSARTKPREHHRMATQKQRQTVYIEHTYSIIIRYQRPNSYTRTRARSPQQNLNKRDQEITAQPANQKVSSACWVRGYSALWHRRQQLTSSWIETRLWHHLLRNWAGFNDFVLLSESESD